MTIKQKKLKEAYVVTNIDLVNNNFFKNDDFLAIQTTFWCALFHWRWNSQIQNRDINENHKCINNGYIYGYKFGLIWSGDICDMWYVILHI